ncbi:MAG: NAD(P)H-dependent flavin oxidoreductase, partial [Spongiibacter sp.]
MAHWKSSRVSQRLALRLPLVQGPFGGGLSSVALTTAVSSAGGLGSFGVHHLSGRDILNTAAQIRQRTDKPFALNLWIPFEGSNDLSVSADEFDTQLQRVAPYFDELATPLPTPPERFAPDYHEQIEALLAARPAVFSFVYGIPDEIILRACRERNITTLGAATSVDEARALEAAG